VRFTVLTNAVVSRQFTGELQGDAIVGQLIFYPITTPPSNPPINVGFVRSSLVSGTCAGAPRLP
jgi:hypothetical protein